MNKQEFNKLKNLLWKSANNLRGSLDASEYKDVILPIFFLKYVNNIFEKAYQEETREHYKEDIISYNHKNILFIPKETRWDILLQEKNPEKIKIFLSKALYDLCETNPEIFKNVFPKNFFIAEKYQGNNLIAVLQLFDKELHINESDYDHFGKIYEYFLNNFAKNSGKKSGEFYTPQCVVNLMVELIQPLKGKIYDPCFGSGGMFVNSYNYIKNHPSKDPKDLVFVGQEKNLSTWRLCKMNMIIHKITSNFLGDENACTFLNDLHEKWNHKIDYILANPPFNLGNYWSQELIEDSRWEYGIPPKGNANYAWIQHMISKLALDGKAIFIMSLGALTSQSTKKIRQKLIEANFIDAIIQLPNQLFYSTGISASLWIIKKNRQNQSILFANFDKSDFGKKQDQIRILNEKEILKIKNIYELHNNNQFVPKPNWYCQATLEQIKKLDYSLLPNEYIEFIDEEFDGKDLKEEIKNDLQELENLNAEQNKIAQELIKELKKYNF